MKFKLSASKALKIRHLGVQRYNWEMLNRLYRKM